MSEPTIPEDIHTKARLLSWGVAEEDVRREIELSIARALLAERERAAKIAESLPNSIIGPAIASAIRGDGNG